MVLTHVKGHYHDAGIQLAEPKQPPAAQSTPIKQTAAAEPLLPPPPPPPAPPIDPPIIAPTALERLSLPASVSIQLQPMPASPSSLSSAAAVQQQLVAADMSMPVAAPAAAAAAATWPHSMFASDSMNNNQMTGLTDTSAVSSINEHGEMDEASSHQSMMIMGGGGGSSAAVTAGGGSWRDPAPYRCGHCHQVSNWKHVIQV